MNLALLQEYVGTDPADLARFVELGLTSLQQALGPMESALADANLAQLRHCGHRAKSTARHLGADDFATACESLEHAAGAGDAAQALALGRTVLQEFVAIEADLQQALQKGFGTTG